MTLLCDFCGEQRSMVYCRSDAACLCLSCDRNVHSANALSKRHSRTLVCDRCHCQPAVVRCTEEKASLCQNCNWAGHAGQSSPIEHKRQTISCYSGCPSADEFSRIWSFFSADQSSCDPEEGLVILEEGDESMPQRELEPMEFVIDAAAMDMISPGFEQFNESESFYPLNEKDCSSSLKNLGSIHETAIQDFNFSDTELSLEDYGAIFDESLDDPQHFFENCGIDGLFGNGDVYGTERNVEGARLAKASSSKGETTMLACSNQASADSTTSCKTDSNICVPIPAPSTRSISYSTLHVEEHPCDNPCNEIQLSSAIRDDAVLRYREKKKARKFDKKIRYASRKARADVRKRVKGRFVKAGDPYDYDPLDLIRSH